LHDAAHPVSEQYRTLWAKIQDELPGAGPHVLLFTAAARGVGTTTAVLNLAVTSCAGGGRRVVVVDANLARPAAAGRLGMTHGPGLAEVVRGSAALEQALAATSPPRLHVLAAGAPTQAAELLLQDSVRWLAARLRERFDLILVDAPVWEACPVDSILAGVADAVYVVVDATDADAPAVHELRRTLAQRGCRCGGLIVVQ
jgi:Mrp family chromosome partitioning ATPase